MNLILFFINPFIAFVRNLANLNQKCAGLVYVAFFALFGYAISFSLTSADSYRIAARFCQTQYVSSMVWDMYQEGELTDVYLILVYSLVKPFTSNPKVLFCVLGTVMGFFSFLSVRQIYQIWQVQKSRNLYIIVLCYFLAISFVNVNGIRFWTATSVFSYFSIQYLYFNKKRALIGVVLTPLIHFGYVIAVISFLIFCVLKRLNVSKTRFFYTIMLFSFVGTLVLPRSFAGDMVSESNIVSETGSKALNTKVKNYTATSENIAKYDARNASRNNSLYRTANAAYTKAFNFVNRVGIFILLSLFYKRRRQWDCTIRDENFFHFALFMFAVGNVASVVVGSGGRFVLLANMYLLFYMAIMWQRNSSAMFSRWIKWLIPINLYALSFCIINAPRLVTWLLWIVPWPITIMSGLDFGPIDYV